MPTVTYPFDSTGSAATNLVTNELHTLTEVNSTTYRILVPKFAPFYVNNFQMVYKTTDGVVTPLTEGVDFEFVFLYIGASRSIGMPVYGSISLLNELTDGYIEIVQYQTLGGDWCCDRQYVLEYLADIVFNPRRLPWERLTNVQAVFPPVNHDQSMDWIKGHDDLIRCINQLADTIALGVGQREQNMSLLVRELVVDKAAVGLGDVENLPIASDSEVIGALPVNKYMTLKQTIAYFANQITQLNQSGGAVSVNQIVNFVGEVNSLISDYLLNTPITIPSSNVSDFSVAVSSIINPTVLTVNGLTQTVSTISIALTDLSASYNQHISSFANDVNTLIANYVSTTDFNQQVSSAIANYLQTHNLTVNAADVQGLTDVIDTKISEAVNQISIDLNALSRRVTAVEDAISVIGQQIKSDILSSNNVFTKTQVMSTNTAALKVNNGTLNWDVKQYQNLRVELDVDANNFTVSNLDASLLGANIALTVINKGGNILNWSNDFIWSNNTLPTLSISIDKIDFITFTVVTLDGLTFKLANTGSKTNIGV